MVWDIVRDSTFGATVRLLSGGKYMDYPEERDFEVSQLYGSDANGPKKTRDTPMEGSAVQPAAYIQQTESHSEMEEEKKMSEDDSSMNTNPNAPGMAASSSGDPEMANGDAHSLARVKSTPIVPVKTTTGTILVDWYRTDDPANPQNWSLGKKIWVALQVCFYTTAVYMSSSIYTSSEMGIQREFGVGNFKSSLGLALYVLGYGLGPLIWSPMSEIPIFGRNVPYIATFAIFIILAVPTALADNLGGLLFLRFLTGFFGSPCLANGGATMQDIFTPFQLPYSIAAWSISAFCGPALGPMVSGFAVAAENWRWSLWEILWVSGPVFIVWFFFLPETSADSILLYRAKRLRKMTHNANLQSQSEIKRRNLTKKAIVIDALIKPFEIMFKDPAVAFTNLYTGLIYGIYYSFFEAFPLVYPEIYGFNLGLTGVAFTSVLIGAIIFAIGFCAMLKYVAIPQMKKFGPGKFEDVLKPAMLFSFGPSIALFMFGWSARESVHWIVSIIGIAIYGGSVFIITMGIFSYIPMSYPQYVASLFAANDACRSAMAFGSVLYGRALYQNLGIGPGSSLLAGLSFLGVIGIWFLYYKGEALRKRSTFAVSN